MQTQIKKETIGKKEVEIAQVTNPQPDRLEKLTKEQVRKRIEFKQMQLDKLIAEKSEWEQILKQFKQ